MSTLCIDGGGTKTAALLLSDQGVVLGCGMGGPLAFVHEGGAVVGRSAMEAVGAALADAGAGATAVDRAVVILGGGNVAEARAAVAAASGCGHIRMIGEPQAAEALARALGYDIVVIAGTGVIAVGLAGPALLLSSGLGVLLGDEGSAFWVGWEGIRAVLRSLDGRVPPTRLTDALPPLLGVTDGGDTTQGSHRSDLAGRLRLAALESTRLAIAALAPCVSTLAIQGDPVALTILRQAGEELALNAIALADRMGREETRVCIAGLGSMFSAGPPLVEAFRAALASALPEPSIQLPELDLIAGAALLAVEAQPRASERLLTDWPQTRARLRAPGVASGGPSIRESSAAVE